MIFDNLFDDYLQREEEKKYCYNDQLGQKMYIFIKKQTILIEKR